MHVGVSRQLSFSLVEGQSLVASECVRLASLQASQLSHLTSPTSHYW